MHKINLLSHNWLVLKINNASLLDHVHLMRGCVIDLGCGEAPYKEEIEEIADQYIAVDWPASRHDASRVDVFTDISKSLPFRDSAADTVVAFQVLEHIPEPELFLAECFRILRSGGTLFLTTPFMWHVHEAPDDYYRFTRYGLDYLLKKSGFIEIEIKEATGFWQMLVLKLNYHTTRFAWGPLRVLWIPVWWLGQILSPVLDRFDKRPEETAGYTMLAKKPDVA